jgi:hypothetical protein
MPWWTWILIWIALIALSLLFYLLLGIQLFRKFMTTVKELGAAGDKLGHLPAPGPAAGTADDDPPAASDILPGAAVFASPRQMRHDYHASKASRMEIRRQRRIQRKAERGQPQALRDIELG